MRYYIGTIPVTPYLKHHGILGMKWGVRRYQNEDGAYTQEGKQRYGIIDRYKEYRDKKYKEKVAYGKYLAEKEKMTKTGTLVRPTSLGIAQGILKGAAIGTGLVGSARSNKMLKKISTILTMGSGVIDALNMAKRMSDLSALSAYEQESGKEVTKFNTSDAVSIGYKAVPIALLMMTKLY